MLFEVTRTSNHGDDIIPYKKCIPIKLTYVDERTCKSFDEFNKKHGAVEGNWTDFGSNHRILENGNIARDIGTKETYGIEIISLEELMNFYRDVKSEIVIRKSFIDKETPCLEIYDDCRV